MSVTSNSSFQLGSWDPGLPGRILGRSAPQLKGTSQCSKFKFFRSHLLVTFIANEPAERRRSAGEAAENSAARRMAYAKKFSIEL